MRLTLAFFAVLSFVVGVSESKADLLYATNFDAPTYNSGALIGQDGWLITGTSTVNAINVASGSVALTNNGQDVNRTFLPVVNAGSVTLQADINVSAAQATGDYFLHLGDGGASNFNARIYARQGSVAGTTFQLAMGTGSGAGVTYGADLNLNQTFTILAQYNFVTGTLNDTGSLLVNGNAYVAATTIGADAASISSVNLRQGAAGNAATLVIDNIAVNSISAVPEPSSIALLALCSTAGVVYRRRRIAKI